MASVSYAMLSPSPTSHNFGCSIFPTENSKLIYNRRISRRQEAMEITTETYKDKAYKVCNGTYYNIKTSDSVIHTLETARLLNSRITLDYGDVKTGRSWGEVNDITGYIGRSTGPVKIPILLYKVTSSGGGGILDSCILSIRY